MGILIDASVLIEHERGRLDLERRIADHADEDFFLSVVTASELLHGVWRAIDPGIRARRSALTEFVLERFPILDIDLQTARIHAEIGARLATQGTPVGANDLWLAASCVAHGLTMVTVNVREFRRVPGLSVESW